ncbi:chromosome segregation protein SMC, partial [Streptomyces sp. NPDC059101]
AGARAGRPAARGARPAAERERAATAARHDALALGLRRKDGTGALLAAADRIGGLLGPAAELLTVAPGFEVPVAAALGAAADAVAVTDPAAAAEALRLLRKEDAGRAAMVLGGTRPARVPAPARAREAVAAVEVAERAGGESSGPAGGSGAAGVPGAVGGPVPAHELVHGPRELTASVARLLRDVVVVGTLAEAEELVVARPELTAVTAEGDLLGAHFAQGGSAGAPSLLEVQASVDQAAAELTELAARCDALAEARRAAELRRTECAALVEEADARRRAADREKSKVAGDLGRLAGQARAAAGEAERSAAAAARAEEALARATEEAEELAARLAAAEEAPGADDEEPDTSVRDRLAADGANARQTEMEARLQARTHEERVKALAGRADGLD